MYITSVTVLLVLKLCLISTLAEHTLPQAELRELDIFMQDEEYKEISRMKRTDEDIQEEGSGEAPPPTIVLLTADEDISPDTQNGTTSLISEDSPPESPANENTEVTLNVDEIATDESPKPDESEISPVIVASRSGFPIDGVVPINNSTDSTNFTISTDSTNTTDIDVTFNNSTNSANSTTGDIDGTINNSTDSSVTPTNSTNANNTAGIDVTINNSTTNVNSTIGDSGISKTNATVTNTAREGSSNNTAIQNETKQSTVSGSGVLFTVIILVVVAGIAGVGYVFYKRRKAGYNPVNVEDTDRELIEIKPENGFGKPITQDEVRLDNDLTPTQPLASPRTFAVHTSDEKKMDEAAVRGGDKSEMETREDNGEFDEEYKKN